MQDQRAQQDPADVASDDVMESSRYVEDVKYVDAWPVTQRQWDEMPDGHVHVRSTERCVYGVCAEATS